MASWSGANMAAAVDITTSNSPSLNGSACASATSVRSASPCCLGLPLCLPPAHTSPAATARRIAAAIAAESCPGSTPSTMTAVPSMLSVRSGRIAW